MYNFCNVRKLPVKSKSPIILIVSCQPKKEGAYLHVYNVKGITLLIECFSKMASTMTTHGTQQCLIYKTGYV